MPTNGARETSDQKRQLRTGSGSDTVWVASAAGGEAWAAIDAVTGGKYGEQSRQDECQ